MNIANTNTYNKITLGNLIHKKLQTNLYNDIFMLGSTKEIHQYKNYFSSTSRSFINVRELMYTWGNHPVSSIADASANFV